MELLLLDLATNNETSFFRDARIYEALANHMARELAAREPRPHKLSIWSAAGSTGQEAYSIAMSLDSARIANPKLLDFDILVSDVSERVLKKAESGTYTQLEIQRGLPATHLVKYFTNEGANLWQASTQLRDKLRFRKLNLLEPFPTNMGSFDIIFCRNVLIYQSVENKIRVVERLLKHLSAGGYLVLGAAESMIGVSSAVKQLHFENAVFYQKID